MAVLFCNAQGNCKHTISGYISEKGSKENLPGVVVYNALLKAGTTSNNYGFYSITLPCDSVELIFSFVGFQSKKIKLFLDKDYTLNQEIEGAVELAEVTVTAEETKRVSQETQMSNISIPIKQIKDIPALLGEKDVLKVIQLMPGVQKGGEGNAGFYVRGGGPDQNLIILDDAPVYNAFHLFGFFSLFNGDALKSVELIKGGFPARYGGRLSSVVDMTMKDGNKEKIHVEGGIGLISSRATVEGPLFKKKGSFLISARRTYLDILAAPFIRLATEGGRAGYFFYDFNTKLNYELDEKNRFFISGYFGKDKFYFKEKNQFGNPGDGFKGGLNWGNATATARWNHLFGSRLFSNTSFIFSNYKFITEIEEKYSTDIFKLKYNSGIRDFALKYDLHYYPNVKHSVKSGFQSIYHTFTPEALSINNSSDLDGNINKKTEVSGLENAIYLEDEFKITSILKVNGGLRLTNFYIQEKNYLKLEPRFSASYNINDVFAVKTSYANMNQYIHLVSSTGPGLPTDLWVPSTKKISPQNSQQVAAGFAYDLTKYKLSITTEGYYKKMKHILAFKEGASFLDTDFGSTQSDAPTFNWENNVTAGQGWSYGGEILVQKKFGKFSGWVGYTLSWTQLQFDSINFGNKYFAKYDRRHDISVVGIYNIREASIEKNGITLSATWVYGTGNAITLPIASYSRGAHNPGNEVSLQSNQQNFGTFSEYTEKNTFRMASYHRMDIGVQFTKKMKHHERTWEFSVYNLYNRKNPYFYYLDGNKLKQITLFPLIPSFSYNFKF